MLTKPDEIVQPNEPVDKVKLYFDLVNEGKVDGAAALYDPNILMVVVSRQREKQPNEAMADFARIFQLGEMLSLYVTPIDVASSSELTYKAELTMKDGPKKVYTVTLIHLVLDSSSGKSDWYIKSVVYNPSDKVKGNSS